MYLLIKSGADSRGTRDVHPLSVNSFIFMQFSANIWRLPLGNSGSDTANINKILTQNFVKCKLGHSSHLDKGRISKLWTGVQIPHIYHLKLDKQNML